MPIFLYGSFSFTQYKYTMKANTKKSKHKFCLNGEGKEHDGQRGGQRDTGRERERATVENLKE